MTRTPQTRKQSELKMRALVIHQRLMSHYGIPEWRDPLPPIDELVSTVLSQNTNDSNRDRAFINLRAHFSKWETVRDAPSEQVIEAIRPAGLANQKGPRIQAILRLITEEQGELSLEFLRTMPPDDVYGWLVSLNGVGPKTATIVMQFSLGMPAFPVDTHIYRVSGRLGIRPAEINAEQAHPHLAALFPEDEYGPAHLNIIRLGREICQARRTNCPDCPLNDLCEYANESGIS
jgi:endonuclease III